jgi:hypothetical protein
VGKDHMYISDDAFEMVEKRHGDSGCSFWVSRKRKHYLGIRILFEQVNMNRMFGKEEEIRSQDVIYTPTSLSQI